MQHDAGPSIPSPTGGPPDDSYHSPSSASQAGRKRKAGGNGSRGVASLTPDQLAKKRANDREAQRAIRERTKHTIETLERRIHELTSQQPYQELQEVIRQKDAIQAENDEIRRRLASIMSIIQPIVGAQGLTGKMLRRLASFSQKKLKKLQDTDILRQIWRAPHNTIYKQASLNNQIQRRRPSQVQRATQLPISPPSRMGHHTRLPHRKDN
jgi:hypothetical protein